MRSRWWQGVFVVLVGFSARAQEPDVVRTLAESVRVGLARSGVAVNAERDLEIASAQVSRAYSTVYPHVSAEATYTRLDELQSVDFGDGTERLGTLDNYGAGARVDQLLFASGKVGAALRAARLARRLGELNYADTIQRLTRDIQVGFLDVLLASYSVAVREESLKQFEQLAERAAQRKAAGTTSEFDLLSAQVRVANETPEVIAARNQHELAVAAFARLLAVPDDAIQLTGGVERVSLALELDELLGYASSNRPSLLLTRVRCDLAASLLHSPDLLFLDEPTIGLDAVTKLAVRDFIKRLNRERGVTFIISSHDGKVIDRAERVISLVDGQVTSDERSGGGSYRASSKRKPTADADDDGAAVLVFEADGLVALDEVGGGVAASAYAVAGEFGDGAAWDGFDGGDSGEVDLTGLALDGGEADV